MGRVRLADTIRSRVACTSPRASAVDQARGSLRTTSPARMVPGRTTLWRDFHDIRGNKTEEIVRTAALDPQYAAGIGTTDEERKEKRRQSASLLDSRLWKQPRFRST